MNVLFITDFTEQFSYRLLRGIMKYCHMHNQPCAVCKMPPSHKQKLGMKGLVDWAVKWKTDVVIAQFNPEDDVTLFRKNGVVAIAQDYITQFDSIPNITAEYELTGAMAADRLCGHAFKNFGFFGYGGGVCWSDGRLRGFRNRLRENGRDENLHIYTNRDINNLWDLDINHLQEWLESIPKPIGIFACDDQQAEILLESCQNLGINVPLDVAIIGVDNDEVTCNLTTPALSSVDMDIEKAGYETAEMVAQMREDKSNPGHDIVIKPIAVVGRGSTGIMATKDPIVAAAMRYIYENRARKILVSDVLKQVPVSRRLLEQRFRDATGASLYTVISNLRMDYFAQQLVSSSETISEIAARMDEPDTKSISRRFLALKGCTPSEFRKREMRKLGV